MTAELKNPGNEILRNPGRDIRRAVTQKNLLKWSNSTKLFRCLLTSHHPFSHHHFKSKLKFIQSKLLISIPISISTSTSKSTSQSQIILSRKHSPSLHHESIVDHFNTKTFLVTYFTSTKNNVHPVRFSFAALAEGSW